MSATRSGCTLCFVSAPLGGLVWGVTVRLMSTPLGGLIWGVTVICSSGAVLVFTPVSLAGTR